jgi:uncharacterized membrane protein
MKALTKILWLISSLLFIVALFYVYSLLPETVGFYFDQQDNADVYITREWFFYSFLGSTVFINLLLIGLSIFVYQLPLSLLALPQKTFWTQDIDHAMKAKEILSRGMLLVATMLNFLILIFLIMVFDRNVSFFDSGQPYPVYMGLMITLLFVSFFSVVLRLAYARLDIIELSTYSGSRG